jgi:hypothetical protein
MIGALMKNRDIPGNAKSIPMKNIRAMGNIGNAIISPESEYPVGRGIVANSQLKKMNPGTK